MIEIRGGKIAQLRQDKNIGGPQRRQRKLNVLLGQDVDDLAAHAEDRVELIARRQRRAEIHRDDDIRPHRPRDVDRQVVGEPSIDQNLAVELGRRDRPRHRHTRPHHVRKLAVGEHGRLAGHEIGGDRAERNAQLVELAIPLGLRQVAQHGFQLHA